MPEIKVIVISSVRPEPTSGGNLILYRLLMNQPGLVLEVHGTGQTRLTPATCLRRAIGKLGQMGFRRLAEDAWAFWEGRWLDGFLPRTVAADRKTVVLTVAHGDACMTALRFAKKHHLPLVTFFQDWWPDMPEVHDFARRKLGNNFRRLALESSAAICVSDGMRINLGKSVNAKLIYDKPAAFAAPEYSAKPSAGKVPLNLLYFGNLREYGPMLGQALVSLNHSNEVRLEVRGRNPDWPQPLQSEMSRRGLWRDFVPRTELDAWLAGADAFLIPMVFDSSLRRRMETSFPSKLIEAAQIGKPLVIWGPEYCSAVKWAQKENRALCVTRPHADDLLEILKKLASDPMEQQRLAVAARMAARTEFDPDRIHQQFLETLETAMSA